MDEVYLFGKYTSNVSDERGIHLTADVLMCAHVYTRQLQIKSKLR